MEYYKPLEDWIRTNGTYATGVELYKALGKDEYLKTSLFARKESGFIYEKLRVELTLIYKELKVVMEVPIVSDKDKVERLKGKEPAGEKNGTMGTDGTAKPIKKHEYTSLSTDEFFNLPVELQRARLEISQYYAEVIKLRKLIKRELNLPPALGTINLQEAYGIMSQITKDKRPVPFNLLWVTYNEDTGLGGEVMNLDCMLKFGNKTGSRYKTIAPKESDRRDPRHDIHGTMNVQIVNSIELRKLHTWLIFRLNNWDVVIGENG